MTVYFQGAEFEDFPNKAAGITAQTGAGWYNSANARMAFWCHSTPLIAPVGVAEAWCHFMYRYHENYIQQAEDHFIHFTNNAGTMVMSLSWNSTTSLKLRLWNGTTLAYIDDFYVDSLASLRPFDIHFKPGPAGTAELRIFVSKIPRFSRNDLTWNWDDNIVRDLRIKRWAAGYAGGDAKSAVSEVIIADWNTLGAKLVSRPPLANGHHTEWSGTSPGAVSEITPASNYLTTGVADQRQSFTLAALPAQAVNETIENLKVSSQALRDATGPQSLNHFIGIGEPGAEVDYDGADVLLTNDPAKNSWENWALNPATGLAWTVDELNAIKFGVRSRA